ncbi:MAG: hypothetical protein EBU70_14470, partial [Actinobacteria bacterium]|nr:hypothetical protein [Actinomycetota bacterium]
MIVPVTNLKPKHNLYVPSFGGLVYLPSDFGTGRLCTFGMPPFIEAPVLVAEGAKGSLGLWIEDPTFRPYFGFVGGDGKTLSMGLEGVNLMPFESKRESRTVRWKIGAFAGAWPNAMRPYRDWYAQAFSEEIARRDAASWTRDVSVIVDQTGASADALERLAGLVDPSRVLIHEWNTRAAGFDKGLPDHTPAPAFVALVERARALGFRSMGYVNATCVNSQSTAFGQERIAEAGLTRRIASIGSYLKPPKTFANARPDEILYLDPLAPAWRGLHVDAMVRWRALTGADANYADTAGLAGDFGNGVVDGLAGAEGGAAQARELLARNPVPMATEYGTDHQAFSANWTLRYAQVWGTPEVRKGWESRHRPITPYLFSGGTRA